MSTWGWISHTDITVYLRANFPYLHNCLREGKFPILIYITVYLRVNFLYNSVYFRVNFLYPIYTWGWISHTSITQPTWGWISRNSCLLECESPIIIELSAWGWISHTMSTSGLISHTCITVYLKVYFLYLRVSFPNVTISTWGWIP